MELFLPEFDSERGGEQRLCFLIKGEAAGLASVRQQLLDWGGEFLLTGDRMAVWAPAEDEIEASLALVATAVDQARLRPGAGNLELLETRLVPADRILPPDCQSIRMGNRFTLAFDGAQVAPEEEPIFLTACGVFGSGLHPSTRLAVEALEHFAAQSGVLPERVLDVGTGSGVLAMVCARLGARLVMGIDICPEAVAAARENVKRNGLTHRIRVTDTPLAAIDSPCGLVLANLTASVLHRLADEITARLLPHGQVIVSGLRGRQDGEIAETFRRKGLRELAVYREGNWRALRLQAAA